MPKNTASTSNNFQQLDDAFQALFVACTKLTHTMEELNEKLKNGSTTGLTKVENNRNKQERTDKTTDIPETVEKEPAPQAETGSEFFNMDTSSETPVAPSGKGGLDYDQVSKRFFDVLETVTNKMNAEQAANATSRLLSKYTGGQPISEASLPVPNWLPLLADLDEIEKIANGG